MKRVEFIKALGVSLFDTVHSIYEPILEDEADKVDEAVAKIIGIHWLPVFLANHQDAILEMNYLRGKPVILSGNIPELKAFSGICPDCSNIMTLTPLHSTVKCLYCGTEYNFLTREGELSLSRLPVKKKEEIWYIGFPHVKERADIFA
ncbi:IBR domain-containing protein [Bacillus sp. B-jedd]|uniref:IBR domain-containing protein n=1 Tax=Bacillus sp. B-jedd TaxID=1476857 RepID=UPI0005155FBF|nr:IBR domain-containing protein [Bacillus sp. B-jedd]CEG27553.1 hypothetical protein BN1002_02420 [Bacillus sp. B-jedd]